MGCLETPQNGEAGWQEQRAVSGCLETWGAGCLETLGAHFLYIRVPRRAHFLYMPRVRRSFSLHRASAEAMAEQRRAHFLYTPRAMLAHFLYMPRHSLVYRHSIHTRPPCCHWHVLREPACGGSRSTDLRSPDRLHSLPSLPLRQPKQASARKYSSQKAFSSQGLVW